tara:strand:- start:288 stop:1013 length:726 start_codon:yes stop_codon:yes gene_type:complete
MASLAKFLEGGAFGVLNDILSEFHSDDGYAVPNRFECLILPPVNITFVDGGAFESNVSYSDPWLTSNDARAVSLRCESTTMPGRNLSAMDDTNIYGPTREIVNGVTYAGDVEMIFQASSGLKERVFFEEWQKKAFNEETWDVGYHQDYVSEVQIYLLDKQDQRRYGIRLHEAWPKTIGAVALNQAPSSEIIKIPVSFSFRWWETLDITRQPPSLKEKIFSTVINTVERNITRNIPRVLTKL